MRLSNLSGLYILFAVLSCQYSFSQNSSFGDQLNTEISAFYYFDYQNDGFGIVYDELSFSTCFSTNINDEFHVGLRTYVVRGRGKIAPQFSAWHYLIGPTLKYTPLRKKRVEMGLALGYYYGNYCPNCVPTNEAYQAQLHYIGFDVNVDFGLVKSLPQLWLHLSFTTNNVINIKGLNGYNLPLIGLQYRIGETTFE